MTVTQQAGCHHPILQMKKLRLAQGTQLVAEPKFELRTVAALSPKNQALVLSSRHPSFCWGTCSVPLSPPEREHMEWGKPRLL